MDLVLFGIQGSGKGTQAKKLAAEYGYNIFEAGAELRKIASSDSPLGRRVKGYIDQGHLVPHTIIMEVVAAAIADMPTETKIIFDGIPRDERQMIDFDTIMQNAKRPFRCIHFTLNRDQAQERILNRAQQEGRADDANPEIIARRMNTFTEKTVPVINVYKTAGKVTEIDANQPVEAVYADFCRSLET